MNFSVYFKKLRFMEFLFNHLQAGAVVPFYCDTDSMFVGLTNSKPRTEDMTTEEKLRALYDPIVRPEMKDSWESKWKDWFVTTDSVYDQRKPGKLKGMMCKIGL